MDFIPVNEPIFKGNEKKYLNECIDSGWISSEGPFVKTFEEKFSNYVNRNYGIAVANGSAALDVALASLNLKRYDEVILPTHTIISCATSVVHTGATPVVVDSHPETWNMDIDQIKRKITKNTKAIMAVHIFGLPVDMDPILELAKEYGIKVIEDAAQAIGQTYKGKMCGSFGDVSTFSFYPNKHITTGEGGMVVTNNSELATRCRSFRNLCFSSEKRFVHEEMGWNYRITNLQAAIGCAQLENIEYHLKRKREIGLLYNRLLRDVEGIDLPPKDQEYADNLYWVYGLLLNDSLNIDSPIVMNKLGERGIGTRPFFWPMHEQPVLSKLGLFTGEHFPFAEKMARRGFYIPSGLALTDDQVKRVATELADILKEF